VDFLLRWIAPLLIALFGSGLYARGELMEHGYAWRIGAWVFWIISVIHSETGRAIAVRAANEAAALKYAFPPKPKIEPEPVRLMQMDIPAVKWTIIGMDARVIEYIAKGVMNGKPFVERNFTGKGKLTPSEYDEARQEFIARKYLIPGKAKKRARWSMEGLVFLRDVWMGRTVRDPSPPPKLNLLRLVE
jgi:hypothetical protein